VAALATTNCAHHVETPVVVAPPVALPPPPRAVEPVRPPEPKDPPPQAIPLGIMAGAIEPLRGEDPELPDAILASSRGKTLEGAYRICITMAGNVQSVTPVVGIAGADQAVISKLKSWQYQKLPMDICRVQTFSFEIP
jgi:hypothetical protein